MIHRFYDFVPVFYAMPDKGTEITKNPQKSSLFSSFAVFFIFPCGIIKR